MPEPRFRYGALAPVEHPTVYKFVDHPAAALARPRQFDAYAGPASAVLENDDQGQFGSCVGWATAQVVRYVLTKAGMPDPGPLSAWYVYALARQAEGTLGQDAGSDPHDALTVCRNLGIPTRSLMPVDGNLSALPSAAAVADAATRTGVEFYLCNSVDELLTGMGTLGVPGDLCIAVYQDFETPNADETLPPITGGILGYHNIQLRSYDDDKQTARIHNQWGSEWTHDDECTVTYAQLNQLWSQGYIVTHPAIKPAPAKTATTTTLTASSTDVKVGQYITLNVLVAGNNPTGQVTFLDNGAAIGGAAVKDGQAQTTPSPYMQPGSHTITAEYMGDGSNLPSTSAATVLTVAEPVDPSTALWAWLVPEAQWTLTAGAAARAEQAAVIYRELVAFYPNLTGASPAQLRQMESAVPLR